MKDMIKERLVLLAQAQENMTEIIDRLSSWDNSQLSVEKSAFTSMNVSDRILNLSKEGNRLAEKLQEYCSNDKMGYEAIDTQKVASILHDVQSLFQTIWQSANEANETSHNLENEIALQREVVEEIKSSISDINETVDQAMACAEFILCEMC